MLDFLSQISPLLPDNLTPAVTVLVAMVLAGRFIVSRAHRMLQSRRDGRFLYYTPIRIVLQIAVALVLMFILAVMGFIAFNLITGRY